MTTKHAKTLRSFTEGNERTAKNAIIRNMPETKFLGFERAGLVREATAAELAAASGSKAKAKKSSRASRAQRKAAQPAQDAPAATQADAEAAEG